MDEEKRLEVQPEDTIDAPPDEIWEGEDWIGEIENKVRNFRDEMADVAREADEGLFDGPVGKALVFLKRYGLVILLALLPLVPRLVENWARSNPFQPIPAIITEAELQEISDYIVQWDAASSRNMNWVYSMDRDGDGWQDDITVHAFACHEDDREELYTHTVLELPTLWQVLTGEHPLAPAAEEMAFQDGRACIIFTVNGPTAGDRSELRYAVEETLAAIRQSKPDEANGTAHDGETEMSPLEYFLEHGELPETEE